MDEDSRLRDQVSALLRQCNELREEVARLRRILLENEIDPAPPQPEPQRALAPAPQPQSQLNTVQKVVLFRSLFRGREDVYPIRWESPDGRHGYMPHSEPDWNAYYAARPEDRKRVAKETRKYFPLTDEVVHKHLAGKHTIGVYPLLRDETCWFLAVDFDKKTWQEDTAAFRETCGSFRVPAALERSRSGKGGHIWIFFERPVPAVVARKLGALLLTRTMERRHQIGLDSYDRFFPNQDTMPKGGLGNLIALPLQKKRRAEHNTEFVDERMCPYPDQWAFLSAIQRMTQFAAEKLISEAQQDGDLIGVRISAGDDEDQPDPWTLPPSRKRIEKPIEGLLPASIAIVRSDLIYVEKRGLPPALLNRILRLAAFQNPEFYKAQAMRLSTHDKPRVIGAARICPGISRCREVAWPN